MAPGGRRPTEAVQSRDEALPTGNIEDECVAPGGRRPTEAVQSSDEALPTGNIEDVNGPLQSFSSPASSFYPCKLLALPPTRLGHKPELTPRRLSS